MEEMIIEVDENDKKIGLRPRSEFTGKYIHRAAHLLLVNSKGELLSQQRSKNKQWYPNRFEFSASGTVGDETYERCLEREIVEELGISVPFQKLFKTKYFDPKVDKAFHMVYWGKSDEPVTIDKNETQMVKWWPLEDLQKDILKNPENYTPSFRISMEKYFKKFGFNLPD